MRRRLDKACSCSDGDRKALQTLRQTSLAELPTEDYNEIVTAVNAAGGVSKTRGLPRVLIQKAVREFNEGVAKGDFVGHPFRGNQWSDASGASTGGAGGTPSKRKVNAAALRQFDRVMADGRKGRVSPSEQMLGDLNERMRVQGVKQTATDGLLRDVRAGVQSGKLLGVNRGLKTLEAANAAGVGTPEGKALLNQASDIFENENYHDLVARVQVIQMAKGPEGGVAEIDVGDPKNIALASDFVLSQIEMQLESDDDDLSGDVNGMRTLISAARSDESNAIGKIEMLQNYGEDDPETAQDIKAAKRVASAKSVLADALTDTQTDLKEARKAVNEGRVKAAKESDPRKVGGILSEGIRQAIGILEVRRLNLIDEYEAARANDKVGRGGGTGTQFGLPLSALQDRIAALREMDSVSRDFGASVSELLNDEMFAEILEDQNQ